MNQVHNGGTHVSAFEFARAATVPGRGVTGCCSHGSGLRVRKKTTTIAFIPKPQLPPGLTVN